MRSWQIPTVLGLIALLFVALLGIELVRGPAAVTLANPRDLPGSLLDDENGETGRLDNPSGDWMLLFPGFTHCPDICPTTLSRLAAVADALAPARVIMFSVDPERDDPKKMRGYVQYFHPSFGARVPVSLQHLATAAPALGIAYRKVPLEQSYTMDHSTAMPLISPEGQVVAFFPDFNDPSKLVIEIQKIMKTHGAE